MGTQAQPQQRPSGGCSSLVLVGACFALLGFVVCSIRNTFGVESQLEGQAHDIACAAETPSSTATVTAAPSGSGKAAPPAKSAPPRAAVPCGYQMTRYESSPFRRAFEYENGGKRARIECAREYVMIGEYSCHKVFERDVAAR